MTSLTAFLYHPAVYAGLLPLAIVLVVCALPGPAQSWRALTGVLAGFLVSAWMAIGSGLLAFDSTAKLVWAAVPVFALGGLFAARPRTLAALHLLLALALPLWLIAPLITREGLDAVVRYGYLPLFNLAVLAAFVRGGGSSRSNLAALLVLAMGVGSCAALGASVLYAERAFSLAAGIGALALCLLLGREPWAGRGLALPVALLLGTLAGLGTVYANLPVATLVPLAAVPWMVRIPVPHGWGRAAHFALSSGYCILPATIAVAYVWHETGPPAF